jgi:protein involved in polysaccharide export with SLBB domain
MSYLSGADLLQRLYGAEVSLSGFLAPLGVQFSPVALTGDVADPGIYNLPALTPATTEAATYTAAGTPVSDTYTGVRLWDLLQDAGGVSVTAAKNDILSKYVVATGADG